MKRIFSLLFGLLFVATFNLVAQTTIFSDDFESYNAGGQLADQDTSGFWTTWSGSPGSNEDGVISTDQNHTNGGAQSLHVSGSVDQILKLGNKTSGRYLADFYYYIVSGKGAYFNFQRTQQPGTWAFEVFFGNNGQGQLIAANQTINFTHPTGEWMELRVYVDLDEDTASFYVNNTKIADWQYSINTDGTTGQIQLGGIDFYAGAPQGQTPEYYLDDVSYIQLEAGQEPPHIATNVDQIVTNGQGDVYLVIKDTGEQALQYEAFVKYPQPITKTVSATYNELTSLNKPKVYIGLNNMSVSKLEKPIKVHTNGKDVTLTHLQGDITQSLGFNSSLDAEAVALFKNDVMEQYAGMQLSNVMVAVGNLPTDGSTNIRVYLGRALTIIGPYGDALVDQAFTPEGENSQNSIALDNPVFMTGEDLWFGWTFHDPGANVYPLAMDAGPIVEEGNYLRTGVVWEEFSDPNNQGFGNFGIVGTLTGDTLFHWLKLNIATTGIINGGDSVIMPINFDFSQLQDATEYTAYIVLRSNDVDNPYVEIPVVLRYNFPSEVAKTANSAKVYPNPATDLITVVSNQIINKIELMNANGEIINAYNTNAKYTKLNISQLPAGLYFVRLTTTNGIYTNKFIKK